MKRTISKCVVALLTTAALFAPVGVADSVLEPAKRIPVSHEVDVAIAGGGLSGVFAAIAAARNGARTVLIERFGSLGGSAGPGMNTGGGIQAPGPYKLGGDYPKIWVYPEIAGIPKEFAQKLEGLRSTSRAAASQVEGQRAAPERIRNKVEESNAISYLALKMAQEAGVQLLLSTLATDPIMEGNTVKGIYVENKSGRRAVRAKVVIDATGEADVARRAGAPILYPKEIYSEVDGHAPSGVGFFAYVGGVDWDKYDAEKAKKARGSLLPRDIDGMAKTRSGSLNKMKGGLGSLKVQLRDPEPPLDPHSAKVDMGDGVHVSKLEAGMRMYTFEVVQHMKKNVPGCEDCYLIEAAPFLGTRGGPCIKGEYTMTLDDCKAGRRFDDVMYLFGENRALRHTCLKEGKCKWPDVPYRVMVPLKIDGLLAVGRSASGIPDTVLRNRTAVQHMGQAAGIAASLAVKHSVSPRSIDVKALQRKLLEAGFHLGDPARLKQLGLAN